MYVNIKDDLNKRKVKKIAKKLYRISKKEDIVVALNKDLTKNEELTGFINDYGIKILNGKWLFKFLLHDIVDYICKIEHKIPETQNIAILINKKDDIIIGQVLEIAKRVKSLKIISDSINGFGYLEEELYTEYGIALQITNNKKKSLLHTDIIINFDYDEEQLSKYYTKPGVILVNLQENIELKNFAGININDYRIDYDKDNFEMFENEKDFESNVIYESYIYRKDTLPNIQKQLERDNVRLIGLIQDNGKFYLQKSLDKQKILA